MNAVLRRKCGCGGSCGSCRGERHAVPSIVHDVVRAPGKPLDLQARAFYEPRFGQDLSRVRVYDDSRANASAQSVGATAYAFGNAIVFGEGARQRNDILAHELTHVVQQRGAPGETDRVSSPGEPEEREADRAAASVAAGNPVSVAPAGRGGLFRVIRGPQPVEDETALEAQRRIDEARTLLNDPELDAEARAELERLLREAEEALGRYRAAGGGGIPGAAGLARTPMRPPTTGTAGAGAGWGVGAVVTLLIILGGWLLGRSAANSAGETLGRALEALGRGASRARERRQPPQARPQTRPQPDARPPRPGGDVDVDEDNRNGCHAFAIAQRGGHTCHDRYAAFITGQTRDWLVRTPEGLSADFDGIMGDGTAVEVKTGQGLLFQNTPVAATRRAEMAEQAATQSTVAGRCGYRLVWFFNERAVRDLADGFVPAPCQWVPFNCRTEAGP